MKQAAMSGHERGFTLVELMASLTLTLFLLLSLYGMVDINQRVTREQQHITAMQQNGRAALEFMIRDLHGVGFKLINRGSLESFGVIFPNAVCDDTHVSNAITIWSNPGNPEGTVMRDMPQPSSELVLDKVSDFAIGDQAVIIGLGKDGQLHMDIFIVTAIQDNEGQGELHLQHRPPINPDDFTTCYTAGSKVLMVDTITYYVADDGTGVKELYRTLRNRPTSPVATHVKDIRFRYFGEGNPPPELTELTSPAKRLSVRKVEITLTVETEAATIGSGERREITWRTEVAPRNLIYKRNL